MMYTVNSVNTNTNANANGGTISNLNSNPVEGSLSQSQSLRKRPISRAKSQSQSQSNKYLEKDKEEKTDSALALQRLEDVLKAHVNVVESRLDNDKDKDKDDTIVEEVDEDYNIVEAEKQRQVELLYKNVDGLRSNLAKMEALTAVKVKNHRTDNEYLLQEVNQMRHEVCKADG